MQEQRTDRAVPTGGLRAGAREFQLRGEHAGGDRQRGSSQGGFLGADREIRGLIVGNANESYIGRGFPGVERAFKRRVEGDMADARARKQRLDRRDLLTIDGSSIPQVDTSAIIKLISGKSLSTARKLIQTNIPRVYNFEITTNFSFLKSINPLPFRTSNINVVVK